MYNRGKVKFLKKDSVGDRFIILENGEEKRVRNTENGKIITEDGYEYDDPNFNEPKNEPLKEKKRVSGYEKVIFLNKDSVGDIFIILENGEEKRVRNIEDGIITTEDGYTYNEPKFNGPKNNPVKKRVSGYEKVIFLGQNQYDDRYIRLDNGEEKKVRNIEDGIITTEDGYTYNETTKTGGIRSMKKTKKYISTRYGISNKKMSSRKMSSVKKPASQTKVNSLRKAVNMLQNQSQQMAMTQSIAGGSLYKGGNCGSAKMTGGRASSGTRRNKKKKQYKW